ncbi:MAG: V-type ATP synthase subunit E [Christensenellaceae bacterium]|jgi:V/A-type H+-transporting ATPase subunit E
MSGYKQIIDAIEKETQSQVDEIIREAEKKADSLRQKAEKEHAEIAAMQDKKAAREKTAGIERAASQDRQDRGQALLKIRSEAIAGILKEAYNKVLNMPDQEYFDFLFRVFEKSALKGNGEIYFAKHDLGRLPEDFIDRLNGALEDGSVVLKGEAKEIDRGFIISYGKIEQNCSIKSLFEENKNVLWDKVNAYLEGTA